MGREILTEAAFNTAHRGSHLGAGSNGKVDRRRLVALDEDQCSGQQQGQGGEGGEDGGLAHLAPRNETEATLQRMLGEVLGIQNAPILERFIHLGGTSPLVTRFGYMASSHFKISLKFRDLQRYSTIASMAEHIILSTQARPAQSPLASRPVQRALLTP